MKAYLNGTHIPSLFNFQTLICKLVGVIAAVAGSFMVGKEGPMASSFRLCSCFLFVLIPMIQCLSFRSTPVLRLPLESEWPALCCFQVYIPVLLPTHSL